MKIDVHAHVISIAASNGGYVSRRMQRSLSFRYLTFKMGFNREKAPEQKDALYVNMLADHVRNSQLNSAVVLAFDEIYNESGAVDTGVTSLYVTNDYVRDIKDRYPELFLYGASVHPYRIDAIDELERVKAQGAVLVKLLPNSHGFDPSAKKLVPYYRALARLELPLLVHCGYEHTIPVMDQRFGDPRLLELALNEGVKVIIAHAGSSGRFHFHETFGDFLKLIEKYPNCYGDTSALTNVWRSGYLFELLNLEQLNRKYGVRIDNIQDRLIHGSDYPIPITPSAFIGRTNGHARRTLRRMDNPLQLDIELKRLAGLTDDCLSRTAEVLGIKDNCM